MKKPLSQLSENRLLFLQILRFIEGTVAEGAPVIPISAQLKYNIEVVCEYIEKKIPIPLRDFASEPHLIIIRSVLLVPPLFFERNIQGIPTMYSQEYMMGTKMRRLKIVEIEQNTLLKYENNLALITLLSGHSKICRAYCKPCNKRAK
jgi:hypothetical protein